RRDAGNRVEALLPRHRPADPGGAQNAGDGECRRLSTAEPRRALIAALARHRSSLLSVQGDVSQPRIPTVRLLWGTSSVPRSLARPAGYVPCAGRRPPPFNTRSMTLNRAALKELEDRLGPGRLGTGVPLAPM